MTGVDIISQRPTGDDTPPEIGDDVTGYGGKVIAVGYDNTSTLTVPRWVCVISYPEHERTGLTPYTTVRVWHATDKLGTVGWCWDGLRAHRALTDAAADFAKHGGV